MHSNSPRFQRSRFPFPIDGEKLPQQGATAKHWTFDGIRRPAASHSLFLCLLLAALTAFFNGQSEADTGDSQRFALVIGNGAYKVSPLKNPANDARDVSDTLQQLGFQVLFKENARRREMDDAIRTFYSQLRKGGTGLFYYAGHGMQIKGKNYLIPVDARIETESDVEHESIDVGRVLGKMEDAGNPVNIVILDACRDNPFARSFRSSGVGLARMDAPVGSIVAYATAPESVAADGQGRNGVYTKHLLREMIVPGRTIEQVFKAVRNNVIGETDNKQVPWESTSLRGDFYFTALQAQAGSCQVECEPDSGSLEELMAVSQEHLILYDTLKKQGKQSTREFDQALRKIICDFRNIEAALQTYYDSTHDEAAGNTIKNMVQTRNQYEQELCRQISK